MSDRATQIRSWRAWLQVAAWERNARAYQRHQLALAHPALFRAPARTCPWGVGR